MVMSLRKVNCGFTSTLSSQESKPFVFYSATNSTFTISFVNLETKTFQKVRIFVLIHLVFLQYDSADNNKLIEKVSSVYARRVTS